MYRICLENLLIGVIPNEDCRYSISSYLRWSRVVLWKREKMPGTGEEQIRNEIGCIKSDPQRMERFLRENRSFILRIAGRTEQRFVTESEDEWSVALSAFYEAATKFDETKGKFYPFAALVIDRRLRDYNDSQRKYQREIPSDSQAVTGENSGTGEELGSTSEVTEVRRRVAEESRQRTDERTTAVDEIAALKGTLEQYHFTFFEIADDSPKSAKTKEQCARAVRCLLRDRELLGMLRQKRKLPSGRLCRAAGIRPKIIERHRKYIIAAVEILDGEYPYLSEYMRFIKEEAKETV